MTKVESNQSNQNQAIVQAKGIAGMETTTPNIEPTNAAEQLHPKDLTAADVTLAGDHIVQGLALEGRVRAIALRSESTVKTMVETQDLSPIVAAAAGRLLMATQILASDIKVDGGSISLILKGDGPIRGMTMVADSRSTVRGLVNNPHVETMEAYAGKLAVGQAVGKGQLTVIKDQGLKEPYVGTVPLLTGEIAEDVCNYLLTSEQVPSVLALGVKMDKNGVAQAGGLLIQLMPDATEADFDYIEKRAKGGFPDITYLLEEGFSPAQIMDLFLGDPKLQYLESRPLSYSCPCSYERMLRNLLTLGKTDLAELANDPSGIELCCHFCAAKYKINQAEILELLAES